MNTARRHLSVSLLVAAGAVGLATLLASGCGHLSASNPDHLPAGATNVRPVNGSDEWVTFDLDVAGRQRTFLFNRRGGHRAITELRD